MLFNQTNEVEKYVFSNGDELENPEPLIQSVLACSQNIFPLRKSLQTSDKRLETERVQNILVQNQAHNKQLKNICIYENEDGININYLTAVAFPKSHI